MNVYEELHTTQPKIFSNTVKWAGPSLKEHVQPFIWTLLKVCITSKRNDSSTPRNELGRDKGCWGARPGHKLYCYLMANNIQTKRFFSTVIGTEPCLGEHDLAISSNVLEKLHTNQKKFLNPVKLAGPCLGEHDQPFIWTLLKLCTTSKRNESSTPQNELDRVWRSKTSRSFELCWKSA